MSERLSLNAHRMIEDLQQALTQYRNGNRSAAATVQDVFYILSKAIERDRMDEEVRDG